MSDIDAPRQGKPPKATPPKKGKKDGVGSSTSSESSEDEGASGLNPKQMAEMMQHGISIQLKTGKGVNNQVLNVPGDKEKQFELVLTAKDDNKWPIVFQLKIWPKDVVRLAQGGRDVGVISAMPGSQVRIPFISKIGQDELDKINGMTDPNPYISVCYMKNDLGSNPSVEEMQLAFANLKKKVKQEMDNPKMALHLFPSLHPSLE